MRVPTTKNKPQSNRQQAGMHHRVRRRLQKAGRVSSRALMMFSIVSAMVVTGLGRVPVSAQANVCATPATDYGTLTLNITVPADGDYMLWTRMISTTGSGAVDIEVTNGGLTSCDKGVKSTATTWGTDGTDWTKTAAVTNTGTTTQHALKAGNMTVKYIGLSDGVSIDTTQLVGDLSCMPMGEAGCSDGSGGGGTQGPIPSGLKSSLSTDTTVTLSWTGAIINDTPAASYNIYRDGTKVKDGVTTTSYTDTGLTASTGYTYEVTAVGADGTETAKSNAVSVTTQATGGGGGGQAAKNYMYISTDAPNGVATLGSVVHAYIHVVTETPINASTASFTYTPNLEVVAGTLTNGPKFGSLCPDKTAGSGKVLLTCFLPFSTSSDAPLVPLTGDNLLGAVDFKVLSGGPATLALDTVESTAINGDTGDNVVTSFGSTTFQTAAPVTPPSPPAPVTPPTPPSPPAPSRPSGSSGGNGGTTTFSSSTGANTTPPASSTTITPSGTATPVAIPDESTVELSDPAVVQTNQSDTADSDIKKVEYYLNGKKIATITQPPFSYSVNTKQLRNGTYSLKTITYYENGKTETSTVALKVNNPMNATQILLQLKHYAWLFILLFLIIAGAIWYMFFRNKNAGDDGYGDDGYGMVNPDGTGGTPYDGTGGYGDPNQGQPQPPAGTPPPTYGSPYPQ